MRFGVEIIDDAMDLKMSVGDESVRKNILASQVRNERGKETGKPVLPFFRVSADNDPIIGPYGELVCVEVSDENEVWEESTYCTLSSDPYPPLTIPPADSSS